MLVINFIVQGLVKLERSSIKQPIQSHPLTKGQVQPGHLQVAHTPSHPSICLQLFLLFFPQNEATSLPVITNSVGQQKISYI